MVDSNKPSDDRSPIARAVGLAYAVIGLCVQMVIPILGGYWVDQRVGSQALFTIIGVGLGMWMGVLGLIRVTETLRGPPKTPPNSNRKLPKP